MVELAWHNHCKACKTMITVIAAILMLMLLRLTFLLRQYPVTGILLMTMVFSYRCTGNMMLHDFICIKRVQLPSSHHSARINSIGNKYCQQQIDKTA